MLMQTDARDHGAPSLRSLLTMSLSVAMALCGCRRVEPPPCSSGF